MCLTIDLNLKLNCCFRVFVLDKVTDFLLLLGKLVIVGGVGVLSFYVFSGKYEIFCQENEYVIIINYLVYIVKIWATHRISIFFLFLGRISEEVGVDVELPEANYYFIPVIVITVGAYFIADVFFGVYEMAVDTLFLCFLEVKKYLKMTF